MNVQQTVQSGNEAQGVFGDLDQLVLEFARNKAMADELTARNAEIAEELEKAAAFKDGSNTGHLVAGGHKVKIVRRFNTRWVADKLEVARAKLTDELFFKVFKWKYEPRSKKDLDAFLNLAAPDFRAVILAAMETSPGRPGVEMEEIQ